MQTQLLENIIRKFLFEQGGKLTMDLAKVTEKDRKLAKDQMSKVLMSTVNVNAVNVKDFGQIRIELIRSGGRTKVGDTKISTYRTKQILDDATNYLKRSQGPLFLTLTTSDFVWFLISDSTDNEQEKLRAKYSVIAIYAKKTLFGKTPAVKMGNGFIDVLPRGAAVYNFADIKVTDWKGYNNPAPPEKDIIQDRSFTGMPLQQLEYGNRYSTDIDWLYSYFENNFIKLNITTNLEFKQAVGFGCELKSMIEQFQEEQNIPVTSIWDTKTRETVSSLKKLEYEIKNTNALKSKYNTCKIENLDLQNIKYPAGGSFTPENTKEKNIEFIKVQILMLNYVNNNSKNGPAPVNKEWYKELQSKTGIYSEDLINGVRVIRSLAGLPSDRIDITSELIEKIR
jgi:hypothetical protein